MIASMVARLIAAASFEDAATALLQAMLAEAERALASGKYGASARVLRGVLHVRPEGGYQRIFGREHPSNAPVEGTGYLTSANVWRCVVERRCAVSIDVQIGSIYPWIRGDAGDVAASDAGVPGAETRERMLDRDATHVHVVPLRASGGAVHGMITLEASCREAIGDDLVWESACEALDLLACIASPHLASLPARPISSAPSPDSFLPVIGPTTARLIDLLLIFARQEETILVSGPTGAGKSRLARFCHERSHRSGQKFETLDLLSVPEDLQMAELFGWKRGAFTGAVKDSPGALARAAQGTLFIDEVDKLSLRAQAGLLRVLEEKRYRPIGDEGGDKRADVRFIVGTNADLRAAVREGRFREDLYYRINVLPVRLPPLAERLDELIAWAEYMLKRRHDEAGSGGAAALSPEAAKLLLATTWPGNLRQLDNIVRRAYALALADAKAGALVLERRHIERALAYEEGRVGDNALFTQLWRAAQAFASEADRSREGGNVLPLDAGEAMRSLVLAAAVLRHGRDDAFAVLGQQALLKNRNHHRALRRELERVRELIRLLGGEPSAELAALLTSIEESQPQP